MGMDEARKLDCEARLELALEALRTAQERAAAGQLALEVMHEIRNPLEALGHLVYLTAEQADSPTEVRESMRLAEEQVALLRHVTCHTIGLAKPGVRRSTALMGLTEAALRIHRRTIEQKKVHLVKDLPEDVIAEVHAGEMLQVLSNLIVNALDAMPADGTLCLRLRKWPESVQFVISDNGPGIPAEQRSVIFEPFFTTKQEHGTGLGLTLCRKIVERHRGRISLRSSVRPGSSGTTFKISLPA